MRKARLIDPSAVRMAHRQMVVLFCVQVAVIVLLIAFVSSPQP